MRKNRGALIVLLILPCLGWSWDQDSNADPTAPIAAGQPAPAPQTLSAAPAITPLTTGARARYHVRRALGPEAHIGNAFSSGIQTWRGQPEGWGQDAEGYMQRFGMRASRAVISNAIAFGVGEIVQDDPRYRPSGRKRLGGRLSYAASRSFLNHDRHGRPIPAYSRFAGIAASNVITRTWFPPGDDRWSDVGWRCVGQLGWGIAWNVVKEFTPDIKRKLGR